MHEQKYFLINKWPSFFHSTNLHFDQSVYHQIIVVHACSEYFESRFGSSVMQRISTLLRKALLRDLKVDFLFEIKYQVINQRIKFKSSESL